MHSEQQKGRMYRATDYTYLASDEYHTQQVLKYIISWEGGQKLVWTPDLLARSAGLANTGIICSSH